MQFVIFDADGRLIRDLQGRLIVLASRVEARAFVKPGERVEPYKPQVHLSVLPASPTEL